MAGESGKLVGIDLGTTFSAIATLDDQGQAVTLPNLDGEMLTPSAVLLEDEFAVVGQAARDVALERPDRVAMLIKRHMGHPVFGEKIAGRDSSGWTPLRAVRRRDGWSATNRTVANIERGLSRKAKRTNTRAKDRSRYTKGSQATDCETQKARLTLRQHFCWKT